MAARVVVLYLIIFSFVVLALGANARGALTGFEFGGEWYLFDESTELVERPASFGIGPNGVIYVANRYFKRIDYYASTGSYLGSWPTTCSVFGDEQSPWYIDVAPNGYIYASFPGEQRVKYYTPEGAFLGEWGKWMTPYPAFEGGNAIAVAGNGTVYVANRYKSEVSYFTSYGSFLGKWRVDGYAGGEVKFPIDLAISTEGRVFVVVDNFHPDPYKYKSTILTFSSAGSFLNMWRWEGSGEGEFHGPVSICVSKSDTIYVTSSSDDRIYYFAPNGTIMGAWGEEGSGPGQFRYPSDVAVGPEGNLYVLDFGNNRIQYFRAVYNKE
jgi:tripartite motif-containing protein 71